MKKVYYLFLLVALTFGCAKKTTSNDPLEKTDVPMSFSFEPIINEGYEVTKVNGEITRVANNQSQAKDFDIDGTTASTTFEELIAGDYTILITIFDHDILIAQGEGEATIIPGETTTTNIELSWVEHQGSLIIQVDWDDLINNVEVPSKVLFVGNSYTYYNGGQNAILEQIVFEQHPDQLFDANSVTYGGATLEGHFYSNQTTSEIITGDYDLVIFQEQSLMPIMEPDYTITFADSLTQLAQGTGADTGFFMTWARENDQAMIEGLAATYETCGENTNSTVFPVGRVFQRAIEQNPDIELYSGDGSHPSELGSYLAALTFYSGIWQQSPLDIEYVPSNNISDADRDFVQEIVWDVVQEYYSWENSN